MGIVPFNNNLFLVKYTNICCFYFFLHENKTHKKLGTIDKTQVTNVSLII